MRSIQTGAEAMVDECQRSEESENMLAYSHLTSKETVRKACKSRCAPRQSSLAFLSRRPSPPSPPPLKASGTSTTSAHFRGAHAAFEAAHALKGVLGNLSLTSIYAPIVEITELPRNNTDMDYTSLLSNILEKKDELGRLCAD